MKNEVKKGLMPEFKKWATRDKAKRRINSRRAFP